jgi:hypothetical protein
VHWVHVLWIFESHAERREVAEFVSLSCLEFPDGIVGFPPPCKPQTLDLTEFQVRLGSFRMWCNPTRSGVGPEVYLSGWRCPPVETRLVVSELVVVQELNSRENLVG